MSLPYWIVASAILLGFLLIPFAPLNAQDQREIWVPNDHLEAVLKKMPRAVFLTPEQYEKLRLDYRQAQSDPDTKAVPPPVNAVIRSAAYEGTITAGADVVVLQVTYVIECFTDDWTEVPLILPREHLGHVSIDAATALRATPDGKNKAAAPLLLTHGKGRHTVVANYHLPVTRLPNGNLISLKSPGVPASLKLTLPESADLESQLPFIREDQTATFALPSERGKDQEIRWTAQKVAAIPGAAVLQSCSYLYSLDSTSLQADLGMVINSALTDLPTHYEIEIPKEFRVLSVEGEELLRWTRKPNGLVSVDLVPGDRDATDIRLRVERDVPEFSVDNPDVELSLPVATVRGIHRASGTMTLVGSEDIRVKRIATGALTIPIPDDEEGPATNLPNYIASFRFPVSNESPSVTLSKIQSRFNAQLDTRISLEREAVNLTRTLTILPLEGTLFIVATTLSPDEEIVSVESNGDTSGEGFDWTADDANRILLTWDVGRTQATPATIIIQTRLDPEGWFALGNDPLNLSFTATEIEKVEASSGYLAVAFDESFQVETISTTGLEPRDARTTPVTGTLAWFRLNEYDLEIEARRRAPELEASIVSYALPLANTIELEGQIDLDIRYSGIEELQVIFPEAVAPLVRFDSPLIAEQTLGDDQITWTLRFHQERKGAARIRFSLVIPFEGLAVTDETKDRTFEVELPSIEIPAAKRIRGDWIVEANTDTELDFEADGLDRVDSLQVPVVQGYQPGHRIIAAFRYRGNEWELKVNGTRHPHSEVVTSVIDSLQLDTVVSVDGADRHQAKLSMRSTGEQFLELQLPPEAVVWTLLVDDETVKPVRAAEDTLRVQLPAHENANQQINIHLIYQTPGKEWRGSGRETLTPIRVADRIPVMRTQWFLHLPEGYDYQKFKTNLGQEFEIVDRLLLGEAGKKLGAEMERFDGLSLGYAVSEKSAVNRPVEVAAEPLEDDRKNYAREARSKTRSEFLKKVAEGWEMPVPASPVAESESVLPTDSTTAQIPMVNQKLKTIILPSVRFVDTPLRDALDYLSQRSVELDTQEADPAKKGVNIVLDGEAFGDIGNTPITLRLTNVPLAEALRYTTSLAQLKYKTESHAVVVTPLSTPDADLYTQVYKVPPTFLSMGGMASDGGAGAADPFADPVASGGGVVGTRRTAKSLLEEAGITFGAGSSAVYNAETGQLIVRNTKDQIELVEAYNESLSVGKPAAPGAVADGFGFDGGEQKPQIGAGMEDQNGQVAVSSAEHDRLNRVALELHALRSDQNLGVIRGEDPWSISEPHLAKGFVELSGKSDSNLTENAQMDVYRRGQPIAKLIVTSVEQGRGVADIVPGSIAPGQEIQAGDMVIPSIPASGSIGNKGDNYSYNYFGVEDKVPFLGDLPMIGRLFESSEKIGSKNKELLDHITFEEIDLNGRSLEEAADILNTKLAEAAGDQFPAAKGLSVELTDAEESKEKLGIKLGKVTVLDALDKLTGATNTHYRVTASGVLIAPQNVPLEPMETIFIPLPAARFQTLGDNGELKQTHARNVLLEAGIQFPPGSSAAYNPVSGRLAVKNTRENLEAVVSLYADEIAGAHSAASDGDEISSQGFLGGAQHLRGFDYRDVGKRPLKFELPESGRSYRFSGLYAPDDLTFRFVNWERQIRFAWIWILVGGLAFWLGAWRKLEQPVFLGIAGIIALTFTPLLISTSLSALCNALLIGWIAAIGLALIYTLSRKVVRQS